LCLGVIVANKISFIKETKTTATKSQRHNVKKHFLVSPRTKTEYYSKPDCPQADLVSGYYYN